MRSTCQSRCLEREVIDGVLAQPSSRGSGGYFLWHRPGSRMHTRNYPVIGTSQPAGSPSSPHPGSALYLYPPDNTTLWTILSR